MPRNSSESRLEIFDIAAADEPEQPFLDTEYILGEVETPEHPDDEREYYDEDFVVDLSPEAEEILLAYKEEARELERLHKQKIGEITTNLWNYRLGENS